MCKKKNMITDISAELEQRYGVPGTPERERFDEEAYAFYTGQEGWATRFVGTWEDNRTADEIVDDIRSARTTNNIDLEY